MTLCLRQPTTWRVSAPSDDDRSDRSCVTITDKDTATSPMTR